MSSKSSFYAETGISPQLIASWQQFVDQAQVSAAAALVSQNAAAASQTSASSSASSASTSASNAASSATAAAASQTSATSSATSASTSASTATTQATNAANSAGAAASSASAASTSATNAANSATAAAGSASAASTSATNAANSASAAATSASTLNIPAPGTSNGSQEHIRVNAAKTGYELRTPTQVKSDLGLVIGTNVQAWDADLDALAALSTAAANAGQSAVVASSGGWALGGPLMSYKNLLINGDHRIDQRNAGSAVTPTATRYATDRWQMQASTGSKLTFQRVATSLAPGFPNSLKFTVAAQYAPAATDVFTVRQAVEGFNAAHLAWGTANAKPVTVAFWVQSSVAGQYNIGLQNGAGSRGYGANFTIAAANTPQLVILTVPGDTAGAWAADSSAGLWLVFDLGSGSNFTTAAGSWQAVAVYSTTSSVKFVGQIAGSTFLVGPVQLEIGSIFTGFERRSFQTELMLAQRYYAKCYDLESIPGTAGDASGLMRGFTEANNVIIFNIAYPVRLRATPTLAVYSYQTGAGGVVRNETAGTDIAPTVTSNGQTVGLITVTAAAAVHQIAMLWSADAEL